MRHSLQHVKKFIDNLVMTALVNVLVLYGFFLLVSVISQGQSQDIITTIAGTGSGSYSGDGGAATLATFSGPNRVALDASGLVLHEQEYILLINRFYFDRQRVHR